MSWNAFHNRGETLRTVVDTANERRDGVLPVSVPGVAENFRDELDLIGALLLKWHARLSGNIERSLTREPMDLESAVADAWHTTAEQLPGVRMVIDRCTDSPDSPEMAQAMTRAREHEWARLATAAGLASRPDRAAITVGRRVEELARLQMAAAAEAPESPQVPTPRVASTHEPASVSFVDRIKAVIAA
ncbi:MAG: hypothetical protein JWR90_3335 [Marmoricola sp.]|jgi:hypothetical protein|nr:hypothetical protein [Marmoricola sp.]